MLEMIKQWFTERDSTTFCLVRAMLGAGGVSMIYNFLATQSHDYQSFGTGLCALGVAIAAKNASEK